MSINLRGTIQRDFFQQIRQLSAEAYKPEFDEELEAANLVKRFTLEICICDD
jgi:hypothetical protein